MKEKTKNDIALVARFLDDEFESFQYWLEEQEIEPTEAEIIIEGLREESEE